MQCVYFYLLFLSCINVNKKFQPCNTVSFPCYCTWLYCTSWGSSYQRLHSLWIAILKWSSLRLLKTSCKRRENMSFQIFQIRHSVWAKPIMSRAAFIQDYLFSSIVFACLTQAIMQLQWYFLVNGILFSQSKVGKLWFCWFCE